MCVSLNSQKRPRIIFYLKKCAVTIEAMAAANFSRDDLIDFETALENPPFVEEEKRDFKSRLIDVNEFLKKQKLYNHCDWLKIGKKERCGKRCKQFYCSTHSKYINKGCVIPLPCLCCGAGVIFTGWSRTPPCICV